MSAPQSNTAGNPFRVFGITLAGQLLSLIGSGLTSFALGIEVFRRTGSITKLSLVTFFSTVPALLLTPVAGVLVDRWNRRTAIMLSDLGAGVCTLLIWALIAAGQAGLWPLETWHFYLPFAVSSFFTALRAPALSAATAQLVPKQHLGRANGMIELANAASQLVAPVLAGALVLHIGLQGIVLIDLATFVFAVGSLLFVRFPPLPTSEQAARRNSLMQDMALGWSFIRTRPALMRLLLYSILPNLVLGLVVVLITPLVLSFGNEATLGMVLSLSGLGMVAGGVLMSIWGGPKRLVRGMFLIQLLGGLTLFGGALPATMLVITLCAGLYLFTMPLSMGTSQSLWQRKTPLGVQGRVFAVRRMLARASTPVASLLAGPLADRVFEPWLAPDGALAGSVGLVVGTGRGRGIGFLFVVMGVVVMLNTFITWLSPRVRHAEEELPDAIPDAAPTNVTNLPATPANTGDAPALASASGDTKS